jgi:hypothetical protein
MNLAAGCLRITCDGGTAYAFETNPYTVAEPCHHAIDGDACFIDNALAMHASQTMPIGVSKFALEKSTTSCCRSQH